MLEESLRCRLEALNRGSLPADFQRPRPKSEVSRTIRRADSPPPTQRAIANLLSRGQVIENKQGRHLVIRVLLAELWPTGEQLLIARHDQLTSATTTCEERSEFLSAFPARFVGLDLETCGLGGAALFLVGLIRYIESQFVVELLFARNYAEESAVLGSLATRLTEVDTLVTFNGKSFDWPMVRDRWNRYLLNRITPLPALTHYDVLHHARRRWRTTLPDCKLQTIERMICRRSRTSDIPGNLIPAAYDHFIHTGHTTEIDLVLQHNALDLVTLLDVAMRLAGD